MNRYWEVNYIDVYSKAKGDYKPKGHGHGHGHGESNEDDIFEDEGSSSESGQGPQQGDRRPNAPLTAPPGEPTTTTTKVFTLTDVVTVYADGSRSQPPTPTGQRKAPAKISEYSHLGCFGSTKGFPSFTFAQDVKNLTLEHCVSICAAKGYAATFRG